MEQKRYESDMTPKEKRELEKKKLKQIDTELAAAH